MLHTRAMPRVKAYRKRDGTLVAAHTRSVSLRVFKSKAASGARMPGGGTMAHLHAPARHRPPGVFQVAYRDWARKQTFRDRKGGVHRSFPWA